MIQINFVVVFSVALSSGTFVLAAEVPSQVAPITDACLACICEGLYNESCTELCNAEVCGIYNITKPFWVDADKPTLHSYDNPDADDAYTTCVMDPVCGATTVRNYMSRFAQDCNGDGKVDCIDYALIHCLGAYGCHQPLPTFNNRYFERFDRCYKRMMQNVTYTQF